MQIEMVKISRLNPSEYNPRAISSEAMAGLKASLTRYGMPQPVVINKRSDGSEILVSGHQRSRAAAELGWLEVPAIIVSISLEDEKALNVVMNNKAIEGFFTEELQIVLDEIKLDLGDLTFNELKLDALLLEAPVSPEEKQSEEVKQGKIKITCNEIDKEELILMIKNALLSTNFTGVSIL